MEIEKIGEKTWRIAVAKFAKVFSLPPMFFTLKFHTCSVDIAKNNNTVRYT